MPPHELSVQLAAREAAVSPAEVSESAVESVRTDLRHRCLRKLQRVGWVERTPDGLTATTPRPALEERLSLPPLADPEHPHWEPVSALLARPARVAVVELLTDCERSLPLARLVERLHEDEQLSRGHTLPARPALRTRLYHVDLPKLAAVGLVTFDAADRTAGPTALPRQLLD